MKRVLVPVLCVLLTIFAVFSAGAQAQDKALLRIGVTEEPDSLNPFVAYERAAFETFMLIYDSLVVFDRDLKPVPSLAESWELSADQLTWTFHLRKGVLWSDGTPFTAADVKYTFEKMRDTGLGLYATLVADIAEIEIVDDLTIRFRSEQPKANMLQNVTPILPAHIWSPIADDELEGFENAEPVGTGSFRVMEWKKNEHLTLSANFDHFRAAPKVDAIVYTFFANRDTLAQAVKVGEVDIALGLYQNHVRGLENDPKIAIHRFIENGFTELAFNSWDDPASGGNPLIRDKRIRHAIEYAIDKQKILDVVFEGAGVAGTTLIPPSQKLYHYEPSADELRTYDPARARSVLDAAAIIERNGDGVREDSAGKPLSFVFLLRSENTLEVKAGQMIPGFLRDVGIATTVETIDDGALNDRIFGPADFDMFIWGWGGDVDPGTLLNVLPTDQIGNLNDVYYSNEAYDESVRKQMTLMDSTARAQEVHHAQKILYEDLPYSIIFYGMDLQLVRTDRVEGISPTANGAVLYADTPFNYTDAAIVGVKAGSGLERRAGGKAGLYIGLAAAGIVAGAVILLLLKRSRKSW